MLWQKNFWKNIITLRMNNQGKRVIFWKHYLSCGTITRKTIRMFGRNFTDTFSCLPTVFCLQL